MEEMETYAPPRGNLNLGWSWQRTRRGSGLGDGVERTGNCDKSFNIVSPSCDRFAVGGQVRVGQGRGRPDHQTAKRYQRGMKQEKVSAVMAL